MNLLRDPVNLTRIFFVLICTLVGYWVGRGFKPWLGLECSVAGFILAVLCVLVEVASNAVPSKKVLTASGGLLVGLIIAWFVYPTIPPTIFGDSDASDSLLKARIVCNLLFGYFGIILAIKHANRFSFARINYPAIGSGEPSASVLDTSVIVDGRVKELIGSNFLRGTFLVPEFVLDELQKIADSSDAKRRARGRRGLEILEGIKEVAPRLVILDKDYPEQKDVDHKLIELAKDSGADIITNDFNLQKVAQIHKVRVLNINELANMLKPSVFVGETLTIAVAKEGKEYHQGIGYLEDGTMVVVEDGRARIGTRVEVVVTSILPTPAGRMIFARPTDLLPGEGRSTSYQTPSPDRMPSGSASPREGTGGTASGSTGYGGGGETDGARRTPATAPAGAGAGVASGAGANNASGATASNSGPHMDRSPSGSRAPRSDSSGAATASTSARRPKERTH